MSKQRFPFTNRELSWLDFNERVLELACEKRIPLMERLKFISIFSNNLDEFFMIRVAGIMDQLDLGYSQKDSSGLNPKEILERIRHKVKRLVLKQQRYFHRLIKDLKKEDILINERSNECDDEFYDLIFENSILPSISVITLSASNPFPFIYNKRSAFIVDLTKNEENYIAIIIVPETIKKLYTNSYQDKLHVFTLEHIIASKLHNIFKGYDINNYWIIRVTRNADLTIEEEGSEDLLELVEHQLAKRKKGRIIRVEINKKPSEKIEEMLINNFEINKHDIYETSNFIDLTGFFELKTDDESLYFKKFKPYMPDNIPLDESIFDYLKKNELLMYRPYNDFSLISKLVEIAANDNKTLSIKITIYRANENSNIMENLAKAAKNGKSVSVVIELKARFDEEMNVEWSKKLEEAGCIVTYGMPNLKVHSKNLLITRNENGRIFKYSHMATGNYNEITSHIYTDLDYITSKDEIGFEIVNLFNYLMGYSDYAKWNKITLAPLYLRNKLEQLINEEIEYHKLYKNGHIIIKVNSMIDKKLIEKIYEASINGVRVDLVVRGICSIKTNIKNISENINVISIIGRFLEHPRIFYFYHNKQEKTFISSADFMERNMDRRVEHMIEIDNPLLKNKLLNLLKLNLADNVNAWKLDKNRYKKVTTEENDVIDSQNYFIENKF